MFSSSLGKNTSTDLAQDEVHHVRQNFLTTKHNRVYGPKPLLLRIGRMFIQEWHWKIKIKIIYKMYKILAIVYIYASPHLISVAGHIKKCRRQDKCGEVREAPDMKMNL